MKYGIGVVLAGWLIAGAGCGNVDDPADHAQAGYAGSSGASNAAGSAGKDATGNEAGRGQQGGASNQGGRNSAGSSDGGAVNDTAGSTSDSAGAIGLGGSQGDAGSADRAGNDGESAGASGSAGSAGSAGATDGPNIPCSCSTGKQCLRVTVGRASDTSKQPWVLWPTQADGTGTLVVSAVTDRYVLEDRVRIPNANFRAADASYGVALCVLPGTPQVRAFLDHGDDEDPRQVTSSDYLDSCALGKAACFRCFNVPVSAGTIVDLKIDLATTCD